MPRDCEFVVRVRPKTGREYTEGPQPVVILCSLTGRVCFCEEVPLTCTRRTWAMAYAAKHGEPPELKASGHLGNG